MGWHLTCVDEGGGKPAASVAEDKRAVRGDPQRPQPLMSAWTREPLGAGKGLNGGQRHPLHPFPPLNKDTCAAGEWVAPRPKGYAKAYFALDKYFVSKYTL